MCGINLDMFDLFFSWYYECKLIACVLGSFYNHNNWKGNMDEHFLILKLQHNYFIVLMKEVQVVFLACSHSEGIKCCHLTVLIESI